MSFSPEMERSIAVLLFQWQYGMPASSSRLPRRMLSWSGRLVESPGLAAKPSASGATAPLMGRAPRPAGASAPENLLSRAAGRIRTSKRRACVASCSARAGLLCPVSRVEFAGPRQ